MRIAARIIGLFWALCFAAALAAQTAAPRETAPQARAIKAVIQAQLKAFADDDAKRAFSFASPGIQAQFQTPDIFMAMVRAGYPMVYRPASVAFLPPEVQQDLAVQKVHMTDQQGERWLALYNMARQPNRQWRIGGCVVLRVTAQTT